MFLNLPLFPRVVEQLVVDRPLVARVLVGFQFPLRHRGSFEHAVRVHDQRLAELFDRHGGGPRRLPAIPVGRISLGWACKRCAASLLWLDPILVALGFLPSGRLFGIY